jgi:molecular chaperone Hsp33
LDHLIRATAQGIRAFAAVTTDLAEEARVRHNCYPVTAAALGRVMTGALLMAANLKTEESLTVRFSGDGPAGDIVADAYADGTVRGYVKNPRIDLPLRNSKLDVGGAVGKGQVYVTRFTGLKQPFTGSSELVSGEIAEDLTRYLAISEQTPSSLALGVLVEPDMKVSAAGGFLVQALPNVEDELLDTLEQNLAKLPPVSQLVHDGYDAKKIIQAVFAGLHINLYDEVPLKFNCQCSRERVKNMLISLGKQELSSLAEEGQAEIVCHFCAEKYQFNKAALEALIKTLDNK